MFQKYLPYLLFPIKAIFSRLFYYEVTFKFQGVGLRYMIFLCVFLAIPATFKVNTVLDSFGQLELSKIVAQIPPSYISKDGTLQPSSIDSADKVIYNSSNQPIIAYNPHNTLTGTDISESLIILNAGSIGFKTNQGIVTVPWSSLYEDQDVEFEPLAGAQMVEQAINSSPLTIWAVVFLWMFSLLSFSIIIATAILFFVARLFFKVIINFKQLLRLSSYGSTLIAVLLLFQFYFNLSLSTVTMTLVPIFYVVIFFFDFKRYYIRTKLDLSYLNDPKNPLKNYFYIENNNLKVKPSIPKGLDDLLETIKNKNAQDATNKQETTDFDDNERIDKDLEENVDIHKERPSKTSDQSGVNPDSSIKGPSFNHQPRGSDFNEDMPIFSDQDNGENASKTQSQAPKEPNKGNETFFNP